jgi:hypothetical protein
MKTTITAIVSGLACFGLLTAATPAQAASDLCLQFSTDNGNLSCDFTGDAGFFRFAKAKLPRSAKRIVPLHGRNAGYTAVYGTMTMSSDESSISIAASFTQDAFFGTIDVFIDPSDPAGDHFAYGSYDSVSLNNSCNVRIVDCSLEP